MSELFKLLENAIRDQLIPALIGREESDAERQKNNPSDQQYTRNEEQRKKRQEKNTKC